jgi:hypothetical protein
VGVAGCGTERRGGQEPPASIEASTKLAWCSLLTSCGGGWRDAASAVVFVFGVSLEVVAGGGCLLWYGAAGWAEGNLSRVFPPNSYF